MRWAALKGGLAQLQHVRATYMRSSLRYIRNTKKAGIPDALQQMLCTCRCLHNAHVAITNKQPRPVTL